MTGKLATLRRRVEGGKMCGVRSRKMHADAFREIGACHQKASNGRCWQRLAIVGRAGVAVI